MGLLDPINDRLYAIACRGYGAATTFSAQAQALSPTAGKYRPTLHGAALEDPNYDAAAFDRALRIEWASDADFDAPNNDLDGTGYFDAEFDLVLGIAYGDALAQFVNVAAGTTEDRAALVRVPHLRGVSEANALRFALCCREFWAGTDPSINRVVRKGPSTNIDLAGGRLVNRTRYVLTYGRSNGRAYP